MNAREQTVFIVDDDQAVRDSVSFLLKSVDLKVETFAGAAEFLEAYDADRAGCLLLDIRMPQISGMDLQEKLSSMHAILPIIFLTGHGDIALAVRAMQDGAFHFLEKPFSDQELLDRIHGALQHDAQNRHQLSQLNSILERRAQLTRRELQIIDLVVEGLPNKAIASDLGISERTVEVHRARVMAKMKATSLAHLVRMNMQVK